jgi:hypothetical protein
MLSEYLLSTDSFWIYKESEILLRNHYQILRVFAFLGNTKSSHFFLIYWELSLPLKNWVPLSDYWSSRNLLSGYSSTEVCIECPGDPLAIWPLPGVGQTASPCSMVVWPLEVIHSVTAIEVGQTASSSNGQKIDLKVVVTTLMIWLWVVLWSDCEVRRILPMTSFWSMGYKYSSILCKIALLAIWTAYLTLEHPLLSQTSFPWSTVGVWDSSAWFECSWALWH